MKKLNEYPDGTLAICTCGTDGPLSVFLLEGGHYFSAGLGKDGETYGWCNHGPVSELTRVWAVLRCPDPEVLPETTDDIEDDDPHVYLDDEGCKIWMTPDGPQYMNHQGVTGSLPGCYQIVSRLGRFNGLDIIEGVGQ